MGSRRDKGYGLEVGLDWGGWRFGTSVQGDASEGED